MKSHLQMHVNWASRPEKPYEENNILQWAIIIASGEHESLAWILEAIIMASWQSDRLAVILSCLDWSYCNCFLNRHAAERNPENLIKCIGNRCLSSEVSIQMLGYLILKIISRLKISSYMKGAASPSLAPGENAYRCLSNAPPKGGREWTRVSREREQVKRRERLTRSVRNVRVLGSEIALLLVHHETLNKWFNLCGTPNKGSGKIVSKVPSSANIFLF